MSEIDELQRRITAAMDQIAFGLEKLGPRADSEPDADTSRALEEERTANAQLQERVKSMREKNQAETEGLRARAEAGEARMAQLDIDLQRVRRANAQLSEACKALRDANAEGVGDAHLINKSMMTELDALRAARTADVAEADAILANLQPLLDAAGNTAKEEDA
ncbi:hypothetical protein C1J03_13810 [Sulfitobacter sp. SK012]|uniref:hypothetical protein n=1 Tax=Sulfitobacter sp. SK012 TaxID=1389005 RepID=UPI000E09E449|nr:hypothetical protein [Sulfitobacter sp. SK012]AXI47001.1 hypothetical protein C1J03_13810 [Sulfitobacter sp. SK012]